MLIRSLALIFVVGIGFSGCFPLRDNSILENALINTLIVPVGKTVVGGIMLGLNYVDDQLTETKPPPKVNWKYCRQSNGYLFQEARTCSGGATTITKSEYDRLKNQKNDTASNKTTSTRNFIYCRRTNGTVYESLYSSGNCYDQSDGKISKAQYDRLKSKKPVTATTRAIAQEELSKTVSDTVEANKQEEVTETKSSTKNQPIKAKLKELKHLLNKSLITEEEAAAKRTKLLEDL